VRSATQLSADARVCGTSALAAEIFNQHRGHLLAIAKRNSSNGEEAEDALQDALLLFITHFDPDGSAPPLAWLTLTLKRRCWALYRRRGRERPSADRRSERFEALVAEQRPRPEELVERREMVVTARAQMATLKPQERRALGLLGLGYSYREICELTGWTYTKVNRCISEGRASLRALSAESAE
jgi:RNA polymerase sigma factor (sigma-70 family)